MDYKPTILTGGEKRSDDQIMAAHEAKTAKRVSGLGLPGTKGVGEPLVVMELLQRLRVKDVMRSHDIASVVRTDSLRYAENLMKRYQISGVPVLENRRLFGIISIQDIIKALEGEWIGDPCQKHMSTNLVVLEEDMPLAFAIKYFQNYTFGRFPVLDKERNFVGIVSQRDVTGCYVNDEKLGFINRQLVETRQSTKSEGSCLPYYSMRQFVVVHNDLSNAGKAANEIKKMMKDAGINNKLIRRVAVAAYELEINICIHSVGGTLTFVLDDKEAQIVAKDRGPGIKDVEWALQDGTSTANDWIRSMGFGAGMGLANSKRVSDTFDIMSKVPTGTTVMCGFKLRD